MAGSKRNTPTSLFELLSQSDLNASQPERKGKKSAAKPSADLAPTTARTAAPTSPATAATAGPQEQKLTDDPTQSSMPLSSDATEKNAPPVAAASADAPAFKEQKTADRTIFSMHDSIGPSGAGRRSQAWQRPGVESTAIAGIPRRLILIGAAVLVLLLLVIVLMLVPHPASKPTDIPISAPTGMNSPKLEPFPTPQAHGFRPQEHNGTNAGRVVPAAQVHRSPHQWYLMIITTLPQYAQHAAQFIARHGVSVTVEPAAGGWDAVISVRGFRNLASPAAIAFRRRVVAIGLGWPGAQRTHHSPWNDAYFARVQRYP